MGWSYEAFSISAHLSSHNSEQDDIHEALWADLCRRIEELINEEKYKPITPMTTLS
jgi:hypothetical protein